MSNTCSIPADGDRDPAVLDELFAAIDQVERWTREATALAARAAGSGVAELVDGLSLDLDLALRARMTRADRRMLVTAGEVLACMPAVATAWEQGQISWSQVRGIVCAVRGRGRGVLTTLDARIAAAINGPGLDAYDPDQLNWAIDAAVAEATTGPDKADATAEETEAGSFIAVQARLDGQGGKLYGQLGPLTFAPIVTALNAAAGAPTPDCREEVDADGQAASGWTGTSRGRQFADALAGICTDWLGGSTDRPARPALVVHVDIADVTVTKGGIIDLAVRGVPTTLTARVIEQLATDADLTTVLFDGGRPLAVSDVSRSRSIPAKTRRAVRARDLGCRFPGSVDPLAHCDLHHLRPRNQGGTHDPDNLIAMSRRHHTRWHRHRWHGHVEPTDGMLTMTRDGITYRSLPRGTPLPRAPDPDEPDPARIRSEPPDPSNERDAGCGDNNPGDQPDGTDSDPPTPVWRHPGFDALLPEALRNRPRPPPPDRPRTLPF